MLVIFFPNKDNQTTNFYVDAFLINDEVPFVPSVLVDHRGCALYFFAQENGLQWEDFTFPINTEDVDGYFNIKRGFDYMSNPIYVHEAIQERQTNKFFHKINKKYYA